MHDALYMNQPRLSLQTFFALAETLGLPQNELQTALTSDRYADRIRSDFLSGVRSGVNGTPCFFINGVRHDGRLELRRAGRRDPGRPDAPAAGLAAPARRLPLDVPRKGKA